MRNLFVDARCLQDPAFSRRGIGQHCKTLLEQRLSYVREKCVAVLDRRLPALAEDHRVLFDSTQTSAFAPEHDDACFIGLSPMTHGPLHIARLLQRRLAFKAAVIYDFIPYDMPDPYLVNPTTRMRYATCLSWLANYDVFFPISEYSGHRLSALLVTAPDRVHVTGVAVRDSLIGPGAMSAPKHVLVVGGPDSRKNADVAIKAHARSALADAGMPLLVCGAYGEDWRSRFRSLYYHGGGQQDLLRFIDHVSDTELARLYAEAVVTVCPSRTEGFSIPVVEAIANGSPVVVADCAAQIELVPDPRDHFAPDDAARLRTLIDAFFKTPGHRYDVVSRQQPIWTRFVADRVARRFWQPIAERLADKGQTFAIGKRAKPRIAVASPVPPDQSGVADYTAACLTALARRADVSLFTETTPPYPIPGTSEIDALSARPYLSRKFDAVVSVIGNSHFHTNILDFLLDYGGASVVHDARMINFYAVLRGEEVARQLAVKELRRDVSVADIHHWLHNQSDLPTLFLSEVIEASMPAFVHSRLTQKLIADLYGQDVSYLPFAIYRETPTPTPLQREQARADLGFSPNDFIISTFGGVQADKASDECVWTLKMLDSWGLRAHLVFVGEAAPSTHAYLTGLANQLGIGARVHVRDARFTPAEYNLYLTATDAAIQLRTYKLGGLSGGLLDCIAAGVPCVSNAHLAEAMEAPDFVARVPDGISPLLMAEALATMIETRACGPGAADAARAYYETHNFDVYADSLLRQLELG